MPYLGLIGIGQRGSPCKKLLKPLAEDPSAFDGAFKPQSVAFYVRTDHGRADAGHFILGESNEVNKRVAQFQFTKDGKMGLLGTQGVTHGATPYVAHKWYHVELRFDWEKREVRCKLRLLAQFLGAIL